MVQGRDDMPQVNMDQWREPQGQVGGEPGPDGRAEDGPSRPVAAPEGKGPAGANQQQAQGELDGHARPVTAEGAQAGQDADADRGHGKRRAGAAQQAGHEGEQDEAGEDRDHPCLRGQQAAIRDCIMVDSRVSEAIQHGIDGQRRDGDGRGLSNGQETDPSVDTGESNRAGGHGKAPESTPT